MQHRLEKVIEPLTAPGLLGFHGTDPGHALCKLLLKREGWDWNRQLAEIP
jgi:hypothetical protein